MSTVVYERTKSKAAPKAKVETTIADPDIIIGDIAVEFVGDPGPDDHCEVWIGDVRWDEYDRRAGAVADIQALADRWVRFVEWCAHRTDDHPGCTGIYPDLHTWLAVEWRYYSDIGPGGYMPG